MANYYDNIVTYLEDSSKNNNKLYWTLMKDSFNIKLSNEIPPIEIYNDKGGKKLAYSDLDKIEALNSYFSSISTIDDSNETLPNMYNLCSSTFCKISIEEHEVSDIISILPVNKAIGPDCLSHKMLKSTLQSVVKSLTMLYNRSLSDRIFPSFWKIAHVIPLFKKDDPSLVSNYRPVSLLSCVSKIMERIIFRHVYNYFHGNNLFYRYQAGFLPGHSTVYQLLETYHSIVQNIDEGKLCCMVFCDLSKAFDRVWQKGLIFKLQTYGLSGDILQLFSSYLNHRSQKVMYKDLFSSKLDLYAGVPQGSVLGPLLFLIYVNDVAENMMSMCRLFADDNSLQQCSYNILDIEYKLNHDLHILESWSDKWFLKFNPSKTKVVFFNTKAISIMPKLFFKGDRLECVPVHRHLGLLLSQNLSWSAYIDGIVNNAYKKLGLLKKLKFKLSRNNLSKLYTTFIKPMLEYASVVWDGCSEQDSEKLEKVQLAAARIVTGLPIFATSETLYSETGWETLKIRRYVAKMSTMFKIHKGTVPEYLNTCNIVPNKHENVSKYNTRNKEQFIIPRCRLELFKKSFVPDAVKQWNLLKLDTREAVKT